MGTITEKAWESEDSPEELRSGFGVFECNQVLPLSQSDRRLLLGASLRLLVRKFHRGLPVLADDVARIASFADDAAPSRERTA